VRNETVPQVPPAYTKWVGESQRAMRPASRRGEADRVRPVPVHGFAAEIRLFRPARIGKPVIYRG